MKRSELTTGQHVAVRLAQDWVNRGVWEAIVLDTDTLYDHYRYGLGRSHDPIEWPDPHDPNKTVKLTVQRATGKGGQVALLVHKRSWGDLQWQPELTALASIVGPYEECKAEVDRATAARAKREMEKAAEQTANREAFEALKADYPLLDTSRVQGGRGSAHVTIPIDLLRTILDEAAAR